MGKRYIGCANIFSFRAFVFEVVMYNALENISFSNGGR